MDTNPLAQKTNRNAPLAKVYKENLSKRRRLSETANLFKT